MSITPIASTSNLPPPLPRTSAAAQARSTLPPVNSRIPFFTSAAQPEIVRANQKDLYYLGQLTEQFEEVFRSILGTRWLQKWSKELNQGSRFAYFGLTTLLGSQTLGEEYCDIMQYQVKSRKPPSTQRRAGLLALHIILPYLLAKVYSTSRRSLITRNDLLLQKQITEDSLNSLFATTPPPPKPKSIFNKLLDSISTKAEFFPTFESLTEDYLRSIHLAIFYLFGRYYNLSKRVAGIRFISTQSRPPAGAAQAGAPPSSYEVLGVLMVVQLVVRTGLALYKSRSSSTSPDNTTKVKESKQLFTIDCQPLKSLCFDPDDPEQASPYPLEDASVPEVRDSRCTLCLGGRRDPTATECGHVFCWECIVGWAREKPECPLCRQSIQLSKLLPVYNL